MEGQNRKEKEKTRTERNSNEDLSAVGRERAGTKEKIKKNL